MVALACDREERQKACAFRAPLFEPLLSTGKKTTLFCGQTMDLTAATAYSFVLIQRGAFMLCKNGKIIQVVEQGLLLGLLSLCSICHFVTMSSGHMATPLNL